MKGHSFLFPLSNQSLKFVIGLGDGDGDRQVANAGNPDLDLGETHCGSVWGPEVIVVLGAQGLAQLIASWTNHLPRP